ncbi:class I SAM-dependent DNA methyltransferase [Candidatus Viridilinea mediisalina]|uniref:site-specific DNA-methyltransferase (adenine-specific) n=1 Tax=Candidatus Viridilinea mediisalina TaxID=2024553 RepID=A0A2A6RH32_9CHLR|nr:DNA methyltransferase [Candidatus Viridilinea mediisalina]PDW02185.1 SAM-dependent methyltransferase [Candidatus Viridilinea mediisalina]
MTILTPQAFINKWRAVTVKERSGYQEHFIDLCHLVAHPTPLEDDPKGTRYSFEAGAGKQRGGKGWADVWKRGFFAWEYKGKHANLDRAYQQLLQYRESLHNPPLLVVCDMETIQIHTNFTNTVKRVFHLRLNDLLKPEGMQALRNLFFNPEAFRTDQTPELVTQRAAREFAEIATLMRRYGHDPQRTAHFLIRLLFCLFAEDVGLLPDQVFSKLLRATRNRAAIFTTQLAQLFGAMRQGGFFGADEIPHFDGHLFDDAEVLPLDSESMALLQRVRELDWSNIEPSILGTLFERSLDPTKRSQLGAHYTSRDDILLIIEPVLMAPLRRRWAEVQQQARTLATAYEQAKGSAAKRLQGELQQVLQGFADTVAAMRVLDPACGSGNFLYVALKQLLDLEKEVIILAQELGAGSFFPSVSPEQLYGLEINEYAYELAQITVWIGYIQWLRDNGFGTPKPPILKPLNTIQRMDALLAYDAAGQPVEPPWPEVEVIVGNPPFLGGNKIRKELGDAHIDALFKLYAGRVPAFADLVCYWFERARAMLEACTTQRVGLLATQAIRGGANRKVLERIKESGDIFMAWGDRKWVLEGAAVRVSLVGFDAGNEQERSLDGSAVQTINADLRAALDLTHVHHLPENRAICFMGPSAKAPFDLDAETAMQMLRAPLNPNGRPNTDVVRPVASAVDLVQQQRGKWTIDFGLLPEDEAALYEAPFEYVRTHVYPVRMQASRVKYAGNWWQYARPRVEMREALRKHQRYIATPGVAKHRIFVWVQPEVLCNQGTLVFARSDDYFFGVLHARIHELWARRTGTQVRDAESGFRYTPTTTFETFPFPWPPGQEPPGDPLVAAIAAAAQRLVELRDKWLRPPDADAATRKARTLTKLYNQRPAWLDKAHRDLDAAVLAAYGWPNTLSDEELLARLLALNLARGGVQL